LTGNVTVVGVVDNHLITVSLVHFHVAVIDAEESAFTWIAFFRIYPRKPFYLFSRESIGFLRGDNLFSIVSLLGAILLFHLLSRQLTDDFFNLLHSFRGFHISEV